MSNEHKHDIRFSLALSVFRDPRMQTMFDEEHSTAEERWIALGMAATGVLLVVVYTWNEVDPENVNVPSFPRARRLASNRAHTRIRYEHKSRRRYETGIRFQPRPEGKALCRGRCRFPHPRISGPGCPGFPDGKGR